VFGVLGKWFETRAHESCSTHVHVRNEDRWTLQELKSLAKGIVWLEEALAQSVPESRRRSLCAKSNVVRDRQADGLDGASDEHDPACELQSRYDLAMDTDDMRPVFQHIENASTTQELVRIISPERSLAWNFVHASRNTGCGTIEHRRPPQSISYNNCLHWISLTLAIVHWSFKQDFSKPEELHNPKTEFVGAISDIAAEFWLDDTP
jgi:hypothetical protein